jgi:hypothetical protein
VAEGGGAVVLMGGGGGAVHSQNATQGGGLGRNPKLSFCGLV